MIGPLNCSVSTLVGEICGENRLVMIWLWFGNNSAMVGNSLAADRAAHSYPR